jgi:hypothetical protein
MIIVKQNKILVFVLELTDDCLFSISLYTALSRQMCIYATANATVVNNFVADLFVCTFVNLTVL